MMCFTFLALFLGCHYEHQWEEQIVLQGHISNLLAQHLTPFIQPGK